MTTVSEVVVNGLTSETVGDGFAFYGPGQATQNFGPAGPGAQGIVAAKAGAEITKAPHVHNNSSVHSDGMDKAVAHLEQIIRDSFVNNAVYLQSGFNGQFTAPNGQATNMGELNNILDHLQFNIVDDTFGATRAGENVIDKATGNITVTINASAFLNYEANPGGMNYLVDHEAAHASLAGQKSTRAEWTEWLNLPANATLNHQLNSASTHDAALNSLTVGFFDNSTQFKANEAFANTLGQEYYSHAHGQSGGFLVNPDFGFIH